MRPSVRIEQSGIESVMVSERILHVRHRTFCMHASAAADATLVTRSLASVYLTSMYI